MTTPKNIIGAVEKITFPDFGLSAVAKIDTGASTGAIHCTRVRVVRDSKGQGVLSFTPFDHSQKRVKTHNFFTKIVKSSNGQTENRFFFNTNIKVGDKIYPIILSLTDRTEMKFEVLIGKEFLKENNFLVDVSIENG
ncbi:hypothetical protein DYH10_00365 [Candidatus Saccharibacteria bacterium CPR2]|nr:hypothetical protein [Candidatus Saccharibacteria bacterium CPR2]